MIIKRRCTRLFVQLDNALVRDRRLSLDEHGMLHYLLSLPDDWEVTQVKCAKFWNIGRDRCRRIFRSLRRTGWAQYEPLYGDDGVTLMGSRWIIGDEPGPEPAAEVLAKEEADDQSPADEPTVAPESQNPDALASSRRETTCPTVGPPDRSDFPTVGKQGTKRINKDSYEKTDSTNTSGCPAKPDSDDDDGEPPPRFGEVLRLWPASNVVSPHACEKVFVKFTDKQKRQARDGIKPYLADCRDKGQNRLCDFRTYLDERRFEKFAGKVAVGSALFVVKRATAEAERWRQHLKKHDPAKLAIFEIALNGKGFTAPSRWPPPDDPQRTVAAPASAPTMTEDDWRELAEHGVPIR